MSGRFLRLSILLAGIAATAPAVAGELGAGDARRFIAGRLFAYTCFDGTTGAGRIYGDGSVAGYISIGGAARPRFVNLPSGTLRVKGERYCASVRGIPFEPCFSLQKTSHHSFRGSVSGLGLAYCDFHRRSARVDLVRSPPLRLSPLRSSAVASATAE
jgi:hypothetical protein